MSAPEILFTAEEIQQRVRLMARTIARAPLVPDIAMPVLVGGFVFAADLLRALSWEGVAMDVEMIWLRSYGDKRVASAISMIAGPSEQIAGRHVLVIDGVLDAGRTIAKAVSLIKAAGAASVQVAVIVIVLRWYPETAHRELEDINPLDALPSARTEGGR
jgi:hypoxanthine phosphoribosyltransferase